MGMTRHIECERCGALLTAYRNPVPTVDIIIEIQGEIVVVERKNPPKGMALPGGFVDYGESVADAAAREAREETGLEIEIKYLLGVYSDPSRDRRLHTITSVFVASSSGEPVAGDDAKEVILVRPEEAGPLCFDHNRILQDYLEAKKDIDQQDSSYRYNRCCYFS